MDLVSSSFSLVRQPLEFCSLVRSNGPRGWAGLEGNVETGEDRVGKKFFLVKLLLAFKKRVVLRYI